MKNQALELHSPLPKSFKVCKERTMEKRKIEDSSCNLLLHFWSTSRSPFSTCYIPFQSLGRQESNASNCVRFGAERRKIWPLEDNCSKHVRISHNSPSMCEFRTTAQACAKFVQHLPLVRNSHNTFSLCEIRISLITTQKVPFYAFNSLCFKHFCVVVLHLYCNWHVKDLAMTSNHICG